MDFDTGKVLAERDRRMAKPCNIPLSKAARQWPLNCPLVRGWIVLPGWQAGIFIGDCFQPHKPSDQWTVDEEERRTHINYKKT